MTSTHDITEADARLAASEAEIHAAAASVPDADPLTARELVETVRLIRRMRCRLTRRASEMAAAG